MSGAAWAAALYRPHDMLEMQREGEKSYELTRALLRRTACGVEGVLWKGRISNVSHNNC